MHSAAKWMGPVLLATATWLTASAAQADVVAPPQDGVCPDGTEPRSSHGLDPAFCIPRSCTSDSDCTDDTRCLDVPLCTDGAWVDAACPNGDECRAPTPCTQLRVCAKESGLIDDSEGCSCRLTRPDSRAGAVAAWLLAALLVVRRSRRSPR